MKSDNNLLKDTGAAPDFDQHVGLIGGLAIRAGIFYYDQILKMANAAGKPLQLSLRHADVNTVLDHVGAKRSDGLGTYLGGLANELFDGGCDTVAVTAVAPHLAISEIMAASKGRIVNVLDTVAATLRDTGLERVAIFGNRAVLTTDIFGAVASDMVLPLAPDVLETVHTTYNDIALYGKRGTPAEVAYFEAVAEELMGRGAQAIILAGTDLSSFYSEVPPTFPYLDMAEIHVRQIMTGA